MTAIQYRNALKRLGLSQVAAAHFLGIAIRTSHSYANDEYPVPEAIAKLLRLMVRLELSPADVR